MIEVLREAYKIVKKRRVEQALRDKKAKLAKAFNDLYTYTNEYDPNKPRLTEGASTTVFMPKGGYAWCCPECNKIHYPTSCSVFSGIQYPGCCNTSSGNRLSHGIKIE